MIEFGQKPEIKGFCWCGLPLLVDGGCPKYHKKAVNKERQTRTHGKSKSENRFNNA